MAFESYKVINFSVNGRESIIVCPKKPLDRNLWIWKTEFFEAFNYTERELLERGYYLAYHCVSDMYGCPESILQMKEFYDVAVKEYKLNKKPALFGFSRGGLYASNFALKYPECVGALYLDAPVVDIRSWPGGLGIGPGTPECWEECKACYDLTDESAKYFKGNPLDNAELLASKGIPTVLVCGAVDTLVPYTENGKPFYERYKAAGGKISRVIKPFCDHHPHSLYDTSRVADFIEACYGNKDASCLSFDELSLNGASVAAHGDSITYGAYTAEGDSCPASRCEKRWIEIACQELGLPIPANYGESGISVSATSTVQSERALIKQYGVIDNADIIFIAIGTNDFGTNVVLGSPDDSEDISFYGALDSLCRGLKDKFPMKPIIFVTPIPRKQKTNDLGLSLTDYAKAIKKVADRYDFYTVCGDTLFSDPNEFVSKYMLDGTHPSPEGQKIYGKAVAEQINRIFIRSL